MLKILILYCYGNINIVSHHKNYTGGNSQPLLEQSILKLSLLVQSHIPGAVEEVGPLVLGLLVVAALVLLRLLLELVLVGVSREGVLFCVLLLLLVPLPALVTLLVWVLVRGLVLVM